jgi:ABC-type multidrug transport system fused ATPase/permease subunit
LIYIFFLNLISFFFLAGVYLILAIVKNNLLANSILSCNTILHGKMIEKILRSKVVYFDQTPVGRILNRFSTDMGSLD